MTPATRVWIWREDVFGADEIFVSGRKPAKQRGGFHKFSGDRAEISLCRSWFRRLFPRLVIPPPGDDPIAFDIRIATRPAPVARKAKR